MTLNELNRLSVISAAAEFLRCCGSKRWAKLMTKARPFVSHDVLSATAERLWWSLDAADWLEAFAAHPRIGDRPTSAWSAEEQSTAASPTDDVRGRLVRGNQQYELTFGYTFLVCATLRSAVDLLSFALLPIHVLDGFAQNLRITSPKIGLCGSRYSYDETIPEKMIKALHCGNQHAAQLCYRIERAAFC